MLLKKFFRAANYHHTLRDTNRDRLGQTNLFIKRGIKRMLKRKDARVGSEGAVLKDFLTRLR